MTETLNPDDRPLPLMLRLWAQEDLCSPAPTYAKDLTDAADEIERLAAENALLREERIAFGKTIDRAIADGGAKIERLEAESVGLRDNLRVARANLDWYRDPFSQYPFNG